MTTAAGELLKLLLAALDSVSAVHTDGSETGGPAVGSTAIAAHACPARTVL